MSRWYRPDHPAECLLARTDIDMIIAQHRLAAGVTEDVFPCHCAPSEPEPKSYGQRLAEIVRVVEADLVQRAEAASWAPQPELAMDSAGRYLLLDAYVVLADLEARGLSPRG